MDDQQVAIGQVTDLTYKSWKSYTGPGRGFFKRNIIFGQNGQGKSALAYGIREQFLINNSVNALRYFDRNYVGESMLLEEGNGKIRGVRADFSRKNVQIDNAIGSHKVEMARLVEEFDNLRERKSALIDKVEGRIKVVIDRHRASLNIQNKRQQTLREKVDAWIKDYIDAAAEYPDIDFSSYSSDISEAEIEKVRSLEYVQSQAPEANIPAVVAAMAKDFSSSMIPSADVITWLEEGIKVHKPEDSTCKFCGSPLDYQKVKDRVDGYLADEESKARKTLMGFRDEAVAAAKNAHDIGVSRQEYLLKVDSGLVSEFQKLEEAEEALYKLQAIVDAKLSTMTHTYKFQEGNLVDPFNNARDAELAILTAVQTREAILEKQSDHVRDLIKGAIGYELKNDSELSNWLDGIDANIEENDKGNEKYKKGQADIQNLLSQKTNIGDFASHLDEVLNEIGMPFSIKSEASDYMLVLREDSEKVLTVRDISEGEKNLLALMYFFFEMYDDSKQKHLKDEIKLVIVDDPTSSMDNPNRFYVMSLIRALLAEKGNVQVFVFTHVWDDFCEYSYKKESQSDCAVLEVCKQDGASTIRSCDNSIFPYKQMFRKVNQFACLKKGSPEVEKTALLMPNTMRRVLEEYLRYHTECSGVSSGNVQQIGSALYNSREKWDKNASTSDHTKVSLLINITNVFSHRIDTIVSNEEIYRSARFMMQRIFDNNKTHYEAMVPENERMKWT